MPRPKRPRHIESHPGITGFTPDGTSSKGETYLSIEEFEAIRLIDYLGLDQSQAAEQMNVSRQTFGRILKQGRYNLSKALVIGKRLRVTGGCFKMRSKGNRNRNLRDEQSITDNKEEIMNEQRLRNKDNNQDRGNAAGRGSGQGRGQGQKSGKGQGRGSCQGGGQGQGRGQGGGSCNRGNR